MLKRVNEKDVQDVDKLNQLTINSFLRIAHQKMDITVFVKNAEIRRKESSYGIKTLRKMRQDDG